MQLRLDGDLGFYVSDFSRGGNGLNVIERVFYFFYVFSIFRFSYFIFSYSFGIEGFGDGVVNIFCFQVEYVFRIFGFYFEKMEEKII